MLIRRAEVGGRVWDVRIAGPRIDAIADSLPPRAGEAQLDAEGGALLPGLHDHHLHLFALAAAEASVACGPPAVNDPRALGDALRRAALEIPPGEFLRGVGYHESVGPLDRQRLDAWVCERPVRIQHRSGALWILNSRACDRLQLLEARHPGIERDAEGIPTGRLYRADDWLRERLPPTPAPDLSGIGGRLAGFGVTGVTDATPHNGAEQIAAFERARHSGALPQHLIVMGREDLPTPVLPGIERGAHKVLLSETALPDLEHLIYTITRQHATGRKLAIHCVTRTELLFALAAFEAAGARPGDRIEHAAVAPPECRQALARLGLTVVTQPNFVFERGDAYAVEVDPEDRPHLYCGASFDATGVPLGAGTDAPFGDLDPWAAMRAAVDRRTRTGAGFGAQEALAPERALALFTTPASAPGGTPRRIAAGTRADLCLLDRPWKAARTELSARHVRDTFCGGTRLGLG